VRVTKTNLAKAKDHRERVRMIAEAKGGPDNVTTAEAVSLIRSAGIKVARQTVSTALNELRREPVSIPESDSPEPSEEEAVPDTPETEKRTTKRRWLTVISAGLVALVAAIASYDHMREVALMAGQGDMIAWLLPLSVDGMLVVASVALADGTTRRGIAWVAFLAGTAASVSANIISAEPDTLSRCVAAWPAVALLLTVET